MNKCFWTFCITSFSVYDACFKCSGYKKDCFYYIQSRKINGLAVMNIKRKGKDRVIRLSIEY